MKELTNEQLKAIEKLSGMVVATRSQLAEGLCEELKKLGWEVLTGEENL